MKIIGRNLGEIEGNIKKLSQWDYSLDPTKAKLVKYLEDFYFEIFEKAKLSHVSDFPSEGDTVSILPGMINHICTDNIESLEGIAQYGLLASEWFGKLEEEGEGRFCTFIDKIKPEYSKRKSVDINRFIGLGNQLLLFFDTENEIMKRLIHLDYFEFVNIKKNMPEKLNEIYSKEEIELLDKLIEPLSQYGKKFHDTPDGFFSIGLLFLVEYHHV